MNRSIRRPTRTVQNLRQRMILETEAFLNRELRRASRPRAVSPDTISAAEVQAARDLPEPLFVVFVSPWSDELRELLVTSAGLTLPLLPRGEALAAVPRADGGETAARPPAKNRPLAEVETSPRLEYVDAACARQV